jgi:3-methyladenine DNA glycosylase AlkD
MTLENIRNELRKNSSLSKARIYSRFFKTGKGEYGEGDLFLGLTVPKTREIVKKNNDLDFEDIGILLESKFHEERLAAALILVDIYDKGDGIKRKEVFEYYIRYAKNINNWDLVDLSAYKIIGRHLIDKDKKALYNLAKSKNLWERRISMISCFYFIKNNEFEDALEIAKLHLRDENDLMHKAVGWMLREIGKRNLKIEERFLKEYYKNMPRTMLRYAIEKFDEKKRKSYLTGEIE